MGKQKLLELPGSLSERLWLKERLETLSVWESHALAAITARNPPEQMSGAINCLLAMDDCTVCFPAGDYERLGRFSLRQDAHLPEDILPYVDLVQLGRQYQSQHPGTFTGDCYVICPDTAASRYDGRTLPEDCGWSVKLKLASAAVPAGVWVRLPDYSGADPFQPMELSLALETLCAKGLEDCMLLEARCILPEIKNLAEQYDSLAELVRDSTNLGIVLDEQGQGDPRWMERFPAALEYENCHELRSALNILQNLHCYEWIPCENLAEFGARHLRTCGVSEELLQSGCIDLEGYAADLLETSGYMLTSGETGFVGRNGREFICEFSAPPEMGGPNLG